ncbi:MAG: hypothetical protein AMS22_13730 [Thiotrichales bacterium SG8_50]|nr:MAG: hypothetical protein AMS22_13730 [Thiotrichales bacterium SG8_50]
MDIKLGKKQASAILLTALLVVLAILWGPAITQYGSAAVRTYYNDKPSKGAFIGEPRQIEYILYQGDRAAPMLFEPNVGQLHDLIRYVARGGGNITDLVLLDDGISLHGPSSLYGIYAGGRPPIQDLVFVGMSGRTRITPMKPDAGRLHYYFGNDSANWHTNITRFSEVVYQEIYPGIDAHVSGTADGWQLVYRVEPGGQPDRIQLDARKAKSKAGDGVESADGNEQARLFSLADHLQVSAEQDVGGKIKTIPVLLNLTAGALTFELDDYDRTQPLSVSVAIPVPRGRIPSARLYGEDLYVDDKDNAYLVGMASTYQKGSPLFGKDAYGGSEGDSFVTKINLRTRQPVYTAFFGGSGRDIAQRVTADREGNAYVVGETWSRNFPLVKPYQDHYRGGVQKNGWQLIDGFILKLSPQGELGYATYLGGSLSDALYGVAVDDDQSFYVTGITNSPDFPLKRPLQSSLAGKDDIHITQFSPDGQELVFSTFLGGSAFEAPTILLRDNRGYLYVGGKTRSQDYPTKNAPQSRFGGTRHFHWGDMFLSKLDPGKGELIFSTYLGGSLSEKHLDLAVDGSGIVYANGITESKDFPRVNNSFFRGILESENFFAAIGANGGPFLYSGYYDFRSPERTSIEQRESGLNIRGAAESITAPIPNRQQPVKSYDGFMHGELLGSRGPIGTTRIGHSRFGLRGHSLDSTFSLVQFGNSDAPMPLIGLPIASALGYRGGVLAKITPAKAHVDLSVSVDQEEPSNPKDGKYSLAIKVRNNGADAIRGASAVITLVKLVATDRPVVTAGACQGYESTPGQTEIFHCLLEPMAPGETRNIVLVLGLPEQARTPSAPKPASVKASVTTNVTDDVPENNVASWQPVAAVEVGNDKK